jgi:hypothetical protein
MTKIRWKQQIREDVTEKEGRIWKEMRRRRFGK